MFSEYKTFTKCVIHQYFLCVASLSIFIAGFFQEQSLILRKSSLLILLYIVSIFFFYFWCYSQEMSTYPKGQMIFF
jgi:hypothetical protein